MGASRRRRIFAVGGSTAIAAGTLFGAIGLGVAPAGAAGGSAASEFDCNSGLITGTQQPVPIIAGLVGATAAPSPSAPNSTANSVSVTATGAVGVPNALVAGIVAAFGSTTAIHVTTTATVASTDGTATGSYTWTPTFTDTLPPDAGQATGLTLTAGETTITGSFPGAVVGDAVAVSGTANGGAVLPPTAVIAAVTPTTGTPTSITLSTAVTTGTTAGSTTTIGWANSMEFTAPVNTGSVFATLGTNGGTANFNITGLTGGTIGTTSVPGIIAYGTSDTAAPFSATAPGTCVLTGYDSAGNAAADSVSGGAPMIPSATYSAEVTAGLLSYLVSVGPPPVAAAAASLPLQVNAPVGNAATINVAEGGTGGGTSTYQLSATDAQLSNSPTLTLSGWAVTAAAGAGATYVTSLTVSTSGLVTIVNDATSATSFTFTFTVSNGTVTSSPATITVNVGTPPVDQPITETVTGGNLVLSCTDPVISTTPNLGCATLNLPGITLNGTQQTVTAAAPSNVWVSDNRGTGAVGWSLTATMVPTSATNNANANCATVATFCNSATGTSGSVLHNQIPSGDLSVAISATTGCVVDPGTGNANPNPTAGATGQAFGSAPVGNASTNSTVTLCTAAAGSNTGSFVFAGTYSLAIPSSVYAGKYWGTVEYLVA
ncbi:MAG: hypothetical protein M0Z62_14650 [Actinomycetota bacterium]|nr:hypothetical protein [Actinomycetota bacterium]